MMTLSPAIIMYRHANHKGAAAYFVLKVKFSGKHPGRTHQIPSVSNSSGFPILSTSKRAFWMIFAPVYVTTPAISIEYHLAPLKHKQLKYDANISKTRVNNQIHVMISERIRSHRLTCAWHIHRMNSEYICEQVATNHKALPCPASINKQRWIVWKTSSIKRQSDYQYWKNWRIAIHVLLGS